MIFYYLQIPIRGYVAQRLKSGKLNLQEIPSRMNRSTFYAYTEFESIHIGNVTVETTHTIHMNHEIIQIPELEIQNSIKFDDEDKLYDNFSKQLEELKINFTTVSKLTKFEPTPIINVVLVISIPLIVIMITILWVSRKITKANK